MMLVYGESGCTARRHGQVRVVCCTVYTLIDGVYTLIKGVYTMIDGVYTLIDGVYTLIDGVYTVRHTTLACVACRVPHCVHTDRCCLMLVYVRECMRRSQAPLAGTENQNTAESKYR